MSRKTLTEVVVVIEKDTMMKVPTTVYEHEVPVLIELHGEDKVQVHEQYEVYAPEDFVVADEYERMKAKYGMRLQGGQPNPVVQVWGKGASALANHLGLPRGNAVKHVLNESEQVVRDPRRVGAGEDGLISSNSAADKGKASESEAGSKPAESNAPEVKAPKATKPKPATATKPKTSKSKAK